jgi:type III pantothenate kinase
MQPDVKMSAGGGARILGCDVGNSRVKFGLFDVPRAASPTLPVCLQAAVFPLDGNVDWDRIANWLPENGVRGLLAGANPVGNDRIQREWVQYTGRPPLEQVTDLCRLLNTAVDAPQRVGVDRLLNAVAANVVREPRQPVVIVDSGTATTVDLVDGDGVFRGGAILPGFELAAKSLRAYTALLPLVTIEELAENPRSPLGTNTQDAICSGLYWGHVGAVRELADRLFETLRREHPESPVSPLVLLTGGGGGLLAEQFPEARWLPHLSLQGLVLAGLEGDVED